MLVEHEDFALEVIKLVLLFALEGAAKSSLVFVLVLVNLTKKGVAVELAILNL